jgi:hypothetical protein
VHFVAIAIAANARATFRTSGVHFVALASQDRVSAAKCTLEETVACATGC